MAQFDRGDFGELFLNVVKSRLKGSAIAAGAGEFIQKEEERLAKEEERKLAMEKQKAQNLRDQERIRISQEGLRLQRESFEDRIEQAKLDRQQRREDRRQKQEQFKVTQENSNRKAVLSSLSQHQNTEERKLANAVKQTQTVRHYITELGGRKEGFVTVGDTPVKVTQESLINMFKQAQDSEAKIRDKINSIVIRSEQLMEQLNPDIQVGKKSVSDIGARAVGADIASPSRQKVMKGSVATEEDVKRGQAIKEKLSSLPPELKLKLQKEFTLKEGQKSITSSDLKRLEKKIDDELKLIPKSRKLTAKQQGKELREDISEFFSDPIDSLGAGIGAISEAVGKSSPAQFLKGLIGGGDGQAIDPTSRPLDNSSSGFGVGGVGNIDTDVVNGTDTEIDIASILPFEKNDGRLFNETIKASDAPLPDSLSKQTKSQIRRFRKKVDSVIDAITAETGDSFAIQVVNKLREGMASPFEDEHPIENVEELIQRFFGAFTPKDREKISASADIPDDLTKGKSTDKPAIKSKIERLIDYLRRGMASPFEPKPRNFMEEKARDDRRIF